MLIALWSPKGGSGTSVLAASLALVLRPRRLVRVPAGRSRRRPARDLRARRRTRARAADWLAAGPEAPTEALDRLAVEVAPGVALLPLGRAASRAHRAARGARAGAALAVALARRTGPGDRRLRTRGGAGHAGGGRGRRRRGRRAPRLLPRAAPRGARTRARAHRRRGAASRSRAGRSARRRSPTCSTCRSWPGCPVQRPGRPRGRRRGAADAAARGAGARRRRRSSVGWASGPAHRGAAA